MQTVNELHWHVVYTKPRSEKKVASKMSDLGVENYLPLYHTVRQWSDRKKKIEMPLFPNYVFTRIDAHSRRKIFSITEILKIVSINSRPVLVKDSEIVTIKKALSEDLDIIDEDYFQEGMKVRVLAGHFSGLNGLIISKRGDARLLVRIEGLMKAFSFNISAHLLERID